MSAAEDMDNLFIAEAKIVEKTEQISFVHDENENPNVMIATSSTSTTTVLKTRTEAIIHDETLDDSFFDAGSTSFAETRRQLARPDEAYKLTPVAAKYFRKRKAAVIAGEEYELNLLDMPNEVVNEVFTHLNRRDLLSVGASCMRFFNVAANCVHWRNLDLTGKRILESAFHRLISRRTQNCCLKSAIMTTDPALISRNFTLCCLVRLDLSWAIFEDEHKNEMLLGILKRCRNLEYLSLESQGELTPEIYSCIAENKKLKLLNLNNCKKIPADSLMKIFENCPLIKELAISFTSLDKAASEVVMNHIPRTVTRLAMSGYDNPNFNDSGLCKLLDRLPELVELEVDDNNIITSVFVSRLSECKTLQKASLSRCYNIEPSAFLLLKRLNALNLYGNLNNNGYDFIRKELSKVAVNKFHLSSIGRSHSDFHFWRIDIRDLY